MFLKIDQTPGGQIDSYRARITLGGGTVAFIAMEAWDVPCLWLCTWEVNSSECRTLCLHVEKLESQKYIHAFVFFYGG